MKVLIVKTSSLGDIIQSLYAITDLMYHQPTIIIHWLVQPEYADFIKMSSLVNKVITYDIRAWRKKPFSLRRNFKNLAKELKEQNYDFAIDAQGMFKTAIVKYALKKVPLYGFHPDNLKEKIASRYYFEKIKIPVEVQNHCEKIRMLFSHIFNYPYQIEAKKQVFFSLKNIAFNQITNPEISQLHKISKKYLVLFVGTTWKSKVLSNDMYRFIIEKAIKKDYKVYVPLMNNEQKFHFIDTILDGHYEEKGKVVVLTYLKFSDLLLLIYHAKATLGPDTGLSHLSTFLEVPNFCVFGPTSPKNFGLLHKKCVNIFENSFNLECMPCKKKVCMINENKKGEHSVCLDKVNYNTVWEEIDLL